MNLSLIVAPLVDPVSIEDAFTELRLDGKPSKHPDYAAVKAKLRAATQDCENFTGRAFVQQTLRLSGPGATWTRGVWGAWGACVPASFELLRPPVISIVSVNYYDADNELQVVDPDNYYAPDIGSPALYWAAGYSLPALYSRPDALRIDYLAGYPPGTPDEDYDSDDPPQYLADNVPHPIRQAILLTLRLMYDDQRPDEKAATKDARDSLLWPYKVLRV